jgi:hypothetical protein
MLRQIVNLGGLGLLFLGGGIYFLGSWQTAPAVLVIWAGISLLFVSLAYAMQLTGRDGAHLLFKRNTGAIHPVALIILLPFICSRYVKLCIYRLLINEDPITKLDTSLQLGGRLFPWEVGTLRGRGVAAILDVAAEVPHDWGTGHANLDYIAFPVLDLCAPTVTQLALAVDWVLGHLESGDPVLIQCTMGHGRSATFAAAVLLAMGRVATVDEAMRMMQSKRGRVRLNHIQRRSLELALQSGVLDPRCSFPSSSVEDDS